MAAPDSATVGGKITAAKYNQIVARLAAATAYTPTISNWSSATIAPTTTGRYWRTGDMIHALIQSKLGTGVITVGNITVSLPVAMDTTGMIADSTLLNGTVSLVDVSAGTTGYFGGALRFIDANTVRVLRQSTANPGVLAVTSSAAPFTWQTLDEMSLMLSFPIA